MHKYHTCIIKNVIKLHIHVCVEGGVQGENSFPPTPERDEIKRGKKKRKERRGEKGKGDGGGEKERFIIERSRHYLDPTNC